MGYKVVWSEFAEKQLDEIYEYYLKEAGIKIAGKLLLDIINEPEKLIENPLIGQIEELLKHKNTEYRYLVFKSYKLIYSVDDKKGYIKMADVFDTRQNPPKIKRNK